MGKTVPAYRMALEEEINRWSGFVRALCKADREAFDELRDMCRSYSMVGGNEVKNRELRTIVGLLVKDKLPTLYSRPDGFWLFQSTRKFIVVAQTHWLRDYIRTISLSMTTTRS